MKSTTDSRTQARFRTRLGRTGLVLLSIAAGLVVTGDRTVFSVPNTDTGIDPLDVLTTKTRPNVYLVIDSSSSMAQFTDFATVSASKATATEDEPNSKLAQAKAVLKKLVQDNQGVANFAIARYKGVNTSLPTANRFIYSTDDIDHPSITTTTAQFDLRQFTIAAAPIQFTEGATNRTSPNIPAGDYNTGWDLAAAVQTAMNATVGKTNTYKVTFVDAPGGSDARFTFQSTNSGAAGLTIRGASMTAALQSTLGISTNVSTTGPVLELPTTDTAYNLASADAFTFTENGITRNATLPAGNHSTAALKAAALQTALNGAAGKTNTYTVTYTTSGTDRYIISTTNAGAVAFSLNGNTFAARAEYGLANGANPSTIPTTAVTTTTEPSGSQVAKTASRTSSFNGSGKGRTGVANTEIDWIVADKFFSDITLRVGPDGTPCAIIPAGTPSVTSAAIAVQPMTTCDPTGSPATVGSPVTFKFAGGDWDAGNNTCTGLDPLVSMGACTNLDTQIDDIGPYLEPSLVVSDVDPGAPVTPGLAGYSQTFLGAPTFAGSDDTLPAQKGIRMNAATPVAESLIGLYKEFNSLWTSTLSLQPAGKRQKNFVIFLTDGDDTCETTTSAAASVSTSNLTPHALRAAYAAQELYEGVSTAPVAASAGASGNRMFAWPPASGGRNVESKVTTFVVVFGDAAGVSNANYVAWGGTGMKLSGGNLTGSSFGLRWNASLPTSKTSQGCTTCRDAFTASNAEELSEALQSAVNLTQEGEFSDQQSVTETVYEYVAAAPSPTPTSPPTPTPPAQDPINPLSRYARTVPVILQSTFVMPNFEGHLTAFRNQGTTVGLELWDAGQKLKNRVVNGVTGTDGVGTGEYPFSGTVSLVGNGTLTTMKTSTARIKRRILTTRMNGRLTTSEYNPQLLVDQTAAGIAGPSGGFERVALWPPSAAVSPTDSANSPGILDTALGLTGAANLAAVQALVSDACKGATAGACVTGTTAERLAKAKREAREIILAWLAGATPRRVSGNPKRVSNEIVYEARTWVMAESSLAAPAVVAPPPQAESTDFKRDEYLLYRDGPRKGSGSGTDPCAPSVAMQSTTCFSVNGFSSGLGLRNPDLDGSTVNGTYTSQNDVTLKPVMSVVYHATNAGLHAFRAGPCPSNAVDSGIGAGMTLGCEHGSGESGGEELFAFIPFDQLGKLPSAMLAQKNDAAKVYMLAAPIRFSDVWIDGGWSRTVGSSPSKLVSGTGVWRTIAFFGRGAGGKHLTSLDVTVSGNVGAHTLDTTLPVVMWNRGNPDLFDSTGYAKLGQTWSVPTVSRVVSADFNGNDHVLFLGSGYSSSSTEGSTFLVMSPRTGDIIRSFDIAGRVTTAPNPPFRNKLVASPSVVSELADGKSPLDQVFLGNPAGALTKAVLFPDLHGRIYKYSTATPNSPPAVFADTSSEGVDQPFANSLGLMRFYPTPLPDPVPNPAPPTTLHVFAESGNDNRVALRAATPRFRMYGYRDDGASYPLTPYLVRDFAANFRGQVQPATAFLAGNKPVVFFAGNEFATANAGCISQFNGVLFALNAATNSAAFDLRLLAASDDEFVTMTAQRINAIRIAGSRLVVDTGLQAQVAPPPPEPPTTGQTSTVGETVATVSQGADPSNAAHANFRTTTVPYRLGTSSCRANQ